MGTLGTRGTLGTLRSMQTPRIWPAGKSPALARLLGSQLVERKAAPKRQPPILCTSIAVVHDAVATNYTRSDLLPAEICAAQHPPDRRCSATGSRLLVLMSPCQ